MVVRRFMFASAALVLGATAIGLTFSGSARAAIVNAMTCAQSGPCLEWDNTGGGVAVKGVSARGNALDGQTKFKSAGKTSGKAGVLGEDLSTTGNLDSGVLGISSNGAGVTGTSTSYNAVQGLSTNSTGVYGQSSAAGGYGVAGRNTSTTHDNNGAGVLADGGAADDALHAFGNGANANAIYAFSQTGSALVLNNGQTDQAPELVLQDSDKVINDAIQVNGPNGNVFHLQDSGFASLTGQLQVVGTKDPAIDLRGDLEVDGDTTFSAIYATSAQSNAAFFKGTASGDPFPIVYVQGGDAGANRTVFAVGDALNDGEMLVTDTGNLSISGYLYTAGSCHTGCLEHGRQTHSVGAYAPAATEPTIEDDGEAMLVAGRADVALDPQFANVIDAETAYIVTITPEGDSRGLYVASRTPRGFTVRESQGGHSSIGFAYRIVAKRYGVQAARLPMTVVRPLAVPPVSHRPSPRHPLP